MNKKSRNVILISLVLFESIIIISLIAFMISLQNEKSNLEKRIIELQNNIDHFNNEPAVNNIQNNTTLEDQMLDIAKEKFSSYLENADAALLDYKINNIIIMNDANGNLKSSYIEMGYEPNDILALINYSVKPVDMIEWDAGNGYVENDWVINKVACVCIRNGQIISSGTGW